jgi:hypothetical protein
MILLYRTKLEIIGLNNMKITAIIAVLNVIVLGYKKIILP